VGLTRVFRITVTYDGTDFAGWQVQPGERTVQGMLEASAERINGSPMRVMGSGRTDAGVHAEGQVARFETTRDLDEARVPHALNAYLPPDVVVTHAVRVDPGFHPIGDARSKHYRYSVRVGEFHDPLARRFALHSERAPNVQLMRYAAESLRGTHDFAPFEKVGSPRSSTIRTLTQLDVDPCGPYIYMHFVGTGFLYGMARNLAGTLMRVGGGVLAPEAISAGLKAGDRAIAGPCLPAHGLCLMNVDYEEVMR